MAMPPKQASRSGRGTHQTRKGKQPATVDDEVASSDPFESSDERHAPDVNDVGTRKRQRPPADAGDVDEAEKTIPRDLLTRVLHEFFAKDGTRISRDGNAAVGKYVDVFVREAIARAAVEKKGGFLEVEDLEKIAPQLLLDL
ncbi:Centromere protein X [Paramyrothecium foliicola]|nr:Centromere protein X [Paramyrothecium foliicola]